MNIAPALFSLCLPALCLNEIHAQEFNVARSDSEIAFVRRITPLLRQKCLGCHGRDPDEIEGSLDLRSSESLMIGGDSGKPSVIAGRPDVSPLYLAARRDHDDWSAMPPKEAEKLSAEQLSWLRDWITSGAAWPSGKRHREIEAEYAGVWSAEDGIAVTTSGGLSPEWTNRKYDPGGLWAYQPVRKPEGGGQKAESHNPLDHFIERAMPDGLVVSSRADRRTLIRRATFDLTGLPPTPDDVDAFLNDSRSDAAAFAAVVDRLLGSHHYGERMAQHWLDVVRYADSSGFANDFERGNAWRYRDYVIRSFNDDKPYDQFVREQIAGDEIAERQKDEGRRQNGQSALIIATGFLRMGPWELTAMEVPKIARQRFLDDVTNSVGETFLAHSLQCARCHDHKFDPVPTRDYYSIQAVFATTQLAERTAEFLPVENTDGFGEQSWLQKRRESYEATLEQLDTVLLRNAQQWFVDRQMSSATWDEAVTQATQKGGRYGVFNTARSIMARNGIAEDRFPPKQVGYTPQQFGLEPIAHKGLERLRWEFERYQPYALAVYSGRTKIVKSVNSPVRVPANRMQEGELEETCILPGGDPFARGDGVMPGTLSVLDNYVRAEIPADIAGRRLAFANWVADARNPLTTRVIVNRIWQSHFGRAIAGNPNNFGSTGKRPTHRELLDWLAATFVDDGWSIKALHRRMMNSDVYCRTTHHPDTDALQQLDPLGTSYAVFSPRRLTAEELRDTMLAVSGELNPAPGGIPCRPHINQEVALQPRQVMGSIAAAWTPSPRPEQRNRRSIYVLKLRGLIHPTLEVFNSPGPDFSCERRESSTVTTQVFALFNSPNTHTRALALADRVLKESTNDREALTRCFQLVFSRDPTTNEVGDFLKHWQDTAHSLRGIAVPRQLEPLSVLRVAADERTGEKFSFEEELYSNTDYVADLQPADVNRHVRALADICLVMLNSNEFVYVY